jgi:hypothetical protein
LALAVTSCGLDGVTCGRGRCSDGTTCISIFGDGRKNQGWNDPHYPNTLGEWWCVRKCPGGKSCSGVCLEDPADSDVVVCATDHVDVNYYSAGRACLCDPRTGTCYQDQAVTGFDVINTCYGMYTVIKSCGVNVDCLAGTFHAGDMVPGVREYTAANSYEHVSCPGYPSNVFGSMLPQGRTVRVWVDSDTCP